MPRSLSIAPKGNIYLVLDDFGPLAGHGVRPTKKEPTAPRWSAIYSTDNMKTLSASWPSIPPKAGRVM
jgi:hypothetical protein